ncbi:MAG: alpha/beta fold hydrolase [Anaerolineae bacterium]
MRLHEGLPILTAGVPLSEAKAVMLMIHGRGATPQSILSLADEFSSAGFAYVAPQAADSSWWPQRFVAPVAANEPYFSSALAAIDSVVQQIEAAGIPAEKVILLGFSQGAVLALEYAARHAQRFGGVVGLSGGLFGPALDRDSYKAAFSGTPVFLGCSDVDFHIPKARVEESAVMLRELGAEVTMRLYPNMGHTVNADEIEYVNQLMATVISA